jgi:hypothetical protein
MTDVIVRVPLAFAVVVTLTLLIFVSWACHVERNRHAKVGSCIGKQVYPPSDLTRVAASARPGTTFCIHDGTYHVASNIPVQSGDTFTGVYSDTSRPTVWTDRAEQIFHTASADGATIRNLAVKGAVGGDYCQPSCGRGIGGEGEHLTVDNVHATQNANQGIGGTGDGLLVKNSTIDKNGSSSFTEDDATASAAGIKSVNSMTVLNSRVSDNYWVGVWCDLECGAFEVRRSTISDNGKVGISDEISSGPAVIANNLIQRNGTLVAANRHSGLLIVDSENVNVYSNVFESNAQYGVEIVTTGRPPGIDDVMVHHNTTNGNFLKGCILAGVSCSRNWPNSGP